jgi:hypothetical protein
MVRAQRKSWVLLVTIFFSLSPALVACGASSSSSIDASKAFESYVVLKSQGLANAWDTDVQPLLSSANAGSPDWQRSFIATLTAFSLLAANASDGIPVDVGDFKSESVLFKTSVQGLASNSTRAWMALQNSDIAGLESSLGGIRESFAKLTSVVATLTAKNESN